MACTKKINKIRLPLVPGADVYHVNELVERFNKGKQGTDERERECTRGVRGSTQACYRRLASHPTTWTRKSGETLTLLLVIYCLIMTLVLQSLDIMLYYTTHISKYKLQFIKYFIHY